jgi:hypothetical protein
MCSTSPSLSTARHRYICWPLISMTIEVPPAVRFRPCVSQLLRDRRTKLQDPTADGLVADVQASRGQQILDVAAAR